MLILLLRLKNGSPKLIKILFLALFVNVTLTENIQPFAFLTILLISSFDERVIERVSSWTFEDECLAR